VTVRFPRSVLLFFVAVPFIGLASQASGARILRTVGDELSDEFSSIDGVRELRDERVLVVDARDRAVRLVDFRSGRVVQRGRDGQGPGEYKAPIRIFAAPADSSVIFDGGQSRLLYADPGGTLGRTQTVIGVGTSGAAMTRFVPREGDALGRLYATASALRVTPQGETLADSVAVQRWDRIGTTLAPLAYVRLRSVADRGGALGGPSAIPFVVGDQWAIATDGRLAIVRWDRYRVELVAPDGRRIVGPLIPYEPVRVTPAIREEWRATQPGNVSEPPHWPPVLPPFLARAAVFAPSGHLWVRRTTPDGALPLYDVFDDSARRVFQLQLDRPGEVVGFGRAHAFVARRDADGLWYLRRVALP